MAEDPSSVIAVIGIDIGKNSFHVVGLDRRGAIVLRQKWSRGQVEARLANMPPCLIGMEACVGAHHLSRRLQALGHDARLMPAKSTADSGKAVRCPMPGVVRAIAVAEGQEVKAGETLAIVEAMKMENVLRAERDGIVKSIKTRPGDSLAVDAVIMEFV